MKQDLRVRSAGPKEVLDTVVHTSHPRFAPRINYISQSAPCWVCGHQEGYEFLKILDDQLTSAWEIPNHIRRNFDVRESTKCRHCKSSRRSNLHARTICSVLAPRATCLEEAIQDKTFASLAVAEINACGALHPVLSKLTHLDYSEYAPADKSIPHEDLHRLSYAPESFDLVVTSDTLEHVPDWQLALSEIRRVLKPGGYHIFTVPAILTRLTRSRAQKKGDEIIHLLPASYHGCTHAATSDYIVFSEFGADFRAAIDRIGFRTDIYYRNVWHLSDPNFVYVSRKV